MVATLGILSALAYDETLVNQLIKEEIVQESTFFQHHLERATKRLEAETERRTQDALKQGLEQGLEQGAKKGAIEVILSFLASRFQPRAVYALKPLLENIEDLEQLKQLGSAAAEAESLETFLQMLGAQTNSQNGTDTP